MGWVRDIANNVARQEDSGVNLQPAKYGKMLLAGVDEIFDTEVYVRREAL
jgi:hypothetical protein